MRAVDNKLDVISGGPDFDTAFVDQIFDVFIDGVEDIRKVANVGRLRLAPRTAEGRGRHDLAAEGRLEAPAERPGASCARSRSASTTARRQWAPSTCAPPPAA